jgi:hypothetical protein
LAIKIHVHQSLLNSGLYFFLSQPHLFISPLFLLYQPKAQHPIRIMPALSVANTSFFTFHNTTALPAEITAQIIEYAIADTHLLPIGGGVGMHRAHHPYRALCA